MLATLIARQEVKENQGSNEVQSDKGKGKKTKQTTELKWVALVWKCLVIVMILYVFMNVVAVVISLLDWRKIQGSAHLLLVLTRFFFFLLCMVLLYQRRHLDLLAGYLDKPAVFRRGAATASPLAAVPTRNLAVVNSFAGLFACCL